MNGMEMLVNTALKAAGFTREQFDEGLATGKAKLEDFDTRLRGVEKNIGEILALLQQQRNDNAADDHRGVADDGQ